MDIHSLDSEAERRRAVPLLRQLWTDRDPEAVLAWTGDEDYTLFGALEGDELVGVAGVLASAHLHHREQAWLYDLVVDDPRRGEGIGRELVGFVEAWAVDQGFETVALASPLDRDDAHEFYESQGYERWGYVIERAVR